MDSLTDSIYRVSHLVPVGTYTMFGPEKGGRCREKNCRSMRRQKTLETSPEQRVLSVNRIFHGELFLVFGVLGFQCDNAIERYKTRNIVYELLVRCRMEGIQLWKFLSS